MKILYKTNKKIDGACAYIFGVKGLSTYEYTINLEDVSNYSSEVFLSIDKNIFDEDIDLLTSFLRNVDNYNVKGIMFYDLAVLSLVKSLNVKTPVIWNQDFLVTNYKTCNFYAKQSASGAVIAPVITMAEIKEICENTNIDIFVPVFGKLMMALSKRGLISSYFNHIGSSYDDGIHYMIERGKDYPTIERSYGTKIFSHEVLNAVRYIKMLKECGVKYVILDDFMIDDDIFLKVSKIFERAVLCSSDEELISCEDEIKSIVLNCSTMFFDKKTVYKVKKND